MPRNNLCRNKNSNSSNHPSGWWMRKPQTTNWSNYSHITNTYYLYVFVDRSLHSNYSIPTTYAIRMWDISFLSRTYLSPRSLYVLSPVSLVISVTKWEPHAEDHSPLPWRGNVFQIGKWLKFKWNWNFISISLIPLLSTHTCFIHNSTIRYYRTIFVIMWLSSVQILNVQIKGTRQNTWLFHKLNNCSTLKYSHRWPRRFNGYCWYIGIRWNGRNHRHKWRLNYL